MTLGDVIATGTPGGVGATRNPPLWLKPGDVVEVEIDRLGVLRNGMADEVRPTTPSEACLRGSRSTPGGAPSNPIRARRTRCPSSVTGARRHTGACRAPGRRQQPRHSGACAGDKLSRSLGQQIYVENRTGAANIVGTQAVARATPDGYTFLFATSASLSTNPHTFKKLPYDPLKDWCRSRWQHAATMCCW